MKDSNTYLDHYQELPRAAKWGVLATAFLLVFLFWAQFLQPTAEAWTMQADEMEDNLSELKDSTGIPRDVLIQAIGFGPVELPDRKQQGSLLMTEQVQAVLAEYGITDDNFNMSRPTPMSGSKSVGLTNAGEKLERLKTEVEFKTTPPTGIEIISTLESDPAFEAVSSVKLDRDESGKIRVRITIESWVRVKRGARN